MPAAPKPKRLEPHYAWIGAGIAAVILYGSLFPFAFYHHHDPRGPVGALLASGFRSYSRTDVVANLLLYLPLGFFTVYALQGRIPAVAIATAFGFGLSVMVELVQFYDAGRVQQLADIYSDTLGALLGAAAAVAARRRISSPYLALILTCWLGSRCYPALPDLPMVRFGPLLLVSSIPPLDLFRYFATGLAVALMIEDVSQRGRSRMALPVCVVIVLLVRALAVDVEPAETAGDAAAALMWSVLLWRLRTRAVIAATLFTVLVVLLALAPFHFSGIARPFGWVPFRSFLESGTDGAIRSFFDKAFLYGGLVWLLVRSGVSMSWATAFGGALVFCLRLTQVYLPGRSAEITDTVLLLMLATMMNLISRANRPSMSGAESPHPRRRDDLPRLGTGRNGPSRV